MASCFITFSKDLEVESGPANPAGCTRTMRFYQQDDPQLQCDNPKIGSSGYFPYGKELSTIFISVFPKKSMGYMKKTHDFWCKEEQTKKHIPLGSFGHQRWLTLLISPTQFDDFPININSLREFAAAAFDDTGGVFAPEKIPINLIVLDSHSSPWKIPTPWNNTINYVTMQWPWNHHNIMKNHH